MGDAKDLGPLDWKTPIVTPAGQPTPEFQRRWNTQRANNALIGSVSFGNGPPTGTPSDGAEYVDISGTPALLYIGYGGAWKRAGVRNFIDLADVPGNYSGAGGKLVRVNAGATGLEFDTISQALDAMGATQGDVLYRGASGWTALGPGSAGQVLTSGGAGANPAWAAGGGGAMVKISGVVTSGSQASVTFSAIPQTYRDLEVVISGRGTTAALGVSLNMTVNGLSSAIYSTQQNGAQGTTNFAAQALAATSFGGGSNFGALAAASAQAGQTGFMRMRIYNYASTIFWKSAEFVNKQPNNAATDNSYAIEGTAQIDTTSAITSMTISVAAGGFVDGSAVSLYGIL